MEYYSNLFSAVTDEKALGDGSTSYTMHQHRPNAAVRIAKQLPQARLIYIVRHPIHRIESHWMHLRFRGLTSDPLAITIERSPYMLDTTLYWKQIQYYRQHFSDQQILVVFFEDFVEAPSEVLGQIFRFLDVNPSLTLHRPLEPRNVSRGRLIDSELVKWFRRHPWMVKTSHSVPKSLRSSIRRRLSQPIETRPHWSDALWTYVTNEISVDTAKFLEFYGKKPDFWKMDTPPDTPAK